jgi:hypothetical protein
MKALAASALLIALLSVATSVGAHSTYFGTLAADQPYTVNIDNAQNAQTKTIATVNYLSGGRPATAEREARLGKATKFDVLTVAPGAREAFIQVIPKGTRLIIIDAAPPAFGTIILDVRQGATTFSDTCVMTLPSGCTKILDVQ